MAHAGRKNFRLEKEGNRSNSNKADTVRSTNWKRDDLILKKQTSSSSLKILGQDDEVSEDVLWNGSNFDRNTPISSRSSLSSGSMSRRTPTPSKQISLQAVKRKEEKIEPLEAIDWNEIDKPNRTDERVPTLPIAVSDDDSLSPRNTPLSAEDQLALIEDRTRQMTSALSTCRIDEEEASLSKQLEQIETEREERERKLNVELQRHGVKTDNKLTIEDGQFTYRNDHFRDLSNRDHRDNIDSDFILDGMGKSKNNLVQANSQHQKRKRENEISKNVLDKNEKTLIGEEKDKQEVKPVENESEKNDEGSAETSSDEESDDEEDDLIGEKGKAPNNLLMEFLSCMMEEDYENAEKLCKMILIYEPENEEALNFYPLIQEKRRLEEEDDDDDDDDDEDDDDDDDDDESDDSGEEVSDDDDEDEEDDDSSDGSENEPFPHADSGIASANSD
ncbi:uncharacterized protein DDB_G0283697-like [Ruditapes philippinarum]|uniref:uncharacterized protein DDB_G0283697-like n=1 Tax=Ruditapes philippinarum TaxID=129788 RepID=UPI00295AE8D0|nr:uncharacterized protein DDB_G0283697-like [Ruditapes philippinarum]